MKGQFLNGFLAIIVGFLLVKQGPVYWRMWQKAGEKAQIAEVVSLEGEKLVIPNGKDIVVVLWATWCPPCKVELDRLNKLVVAGKVPPDRIIAISVGEEKDVVLAAVKERGYKFLIALDFEGRTSRTYGADGTPTILLMSADGVLKWMTMGISPTLEYRVKSHVSIKE